MGGQFITVEGHTGFAVALLAWFQFLSANYFELTAFLRIRRLAATSDFGVVTTTLLHQILQVGVNFHIDMASTARLVALDLGKGRLFLILRVLR